MIVLKDLHMSDKVGPICQGKNTFLLQSICHASIVCVLVLYTMCLR